MTGTPPADQLAARLDVADRLPGAQELRTASYEGLTTAPDVPTAVVDVGCGAGRAVAELAERGVPATGIDPDPRMIALAKGRWPTSDFRIADAYALPLADASVGGYRADKVFHELADCERALTEARRVLAPGGRIVLVGQDWDGLLIDSDRPDLTRALVHARADRIVRPRAARGYRGLLLEAGFTDVSLTVHTTVLTGKAAIPLLLSLTGGAEETFGAEQVTDWIAEQRLRADADRLLLAVPFFLATATAP
ncbi:methyltransferase domain-containing protein [Streptomyces profundus]|uniref:methyltransferase domain-containing protein n=1 Tax=Streptomyces profundus TaxID=2867410 RepID=UPI001D16E135|nr:methyltransferase domain-containing protein [Streptomyces sp. MA3_2.13]UED83267.1 methyltransferase domain-containing protein [Streptomyces sp. MA3_2.13]